MVGPNEEEGGGPTEPLSPDGPHEMNAGDESPSGTTPTPAPWVSQKGGWGRRRQSPPAADDVEGEVPTGRREEGVRGATGVGGFVTGTPVTPATSLLRGKKRSFSGVSDPGGRGPRRVGSSGSGPPKSRWGTRPRRSPTPPPGTATGVPPSVKGDQVRRTRPPQVPGITSGRGLVTTDEQGGS